jgi:hypothetical protein
MEGFYSYEVERAPFSACSFYGGLLHSRSLPQEALYASRRKLCLHFVPTRLQSSRFYYGRRLCILTRRKLCLHLVPTRLHGSLRVFTIMVACFGRAKNFPEKKSVGPLTPLSYKMYKNCVTSTLTSYLIYVIFYSSRLFWPEPCEIQ